MSTKRRIARVASAALGALAVASASFTAAPAAPSGAPITIGVIISLTGSYAPLGEPERNAIKAAEADINGSGGIAGRPVKFDIQDDEGKPDTAAQLATQMVGAKDAMIIGGSITPTSIAIARVASDAKVVQIFMTPTQTIWNTKNGVAKYVFEATPRNELEATKLLNFAKAHFHSSKVAVIHDEQPYGITGDAVVSDAMKTVGGLDKVDDEGFAPSATDVTSQILKVKQSGADTMIIWTAAPAGAIAVKQVKQLGVKVNIIGSTGIVSDNFLKVAGDAGDGVYSDLDLNVTYPNNEQKHFLALYRQMWKARANNFASFAWDAAHLAAQALTATKGNADGDKVAAALESKPYRGSTGFFKFTATDHNGLSPSDVHIAVDKNQIWFTLKDTDK
jgi:branched-chain amino acid transport system substrate-binding protein